MSNLRKTAPIFDKTSKRKVGAPGDDASSSSSSSSDEDDANVSDIAEEEVSPAALLDKESPEYRLMIVRAAKKNNWARIEVLIRKISKRDKRLNAADPETGETALMIACQHSRALIIQRLCNSGALVNLRCNDRRTALHFAASESHEEVLRILLAANADPNLFGGENSQLPIHITASRKYGLAHSQVILRASLKECRLQRDNFGNLPITYAILSGFPLLVKELLQYYPAEQVKWRDERNGDCLVHLAARHKQAAIMNTLVMDAGADVNVQNKDGHTPLYIAAKLGDVKMTKILQTFKANPDLCDKNEWTPLHVASDNGHTQVVELLVERFKANLHLRTKDGSTLMHLAAEKGFADTVYSFIKQGVPLNMANKAGVLCLHVAAQNGHLQVVRTLISKGSNVDARTKENVTALHQSVFNNKPEILQTLLGFGAKVDIKGGPYKEAALHVAAKLPTGLTCAKILIQSGAAVNITTEETLETPLHYAARSGSVELLRILLEERADPMQLNRSGETALHIACRHCHFGVVKAIINFINNHVKGKDASNIVNLDNDEGETSFHLACELSKSQSHHPFEETDIIRLLLQNGADPLQTTYLTHETSLHYCARSGNPDILLEIIKQLGTGFQTLCNKQDRMGWSPLMTACAAGHAQVADMLLSYAARVDVFDEHGKAALHLAAENGNVSCCDTLLNYKAFVNSKSRLGISPLHFAAQSGFANLVKDLVQKHHAAINALSLDKKTPLHLAAEAGRKDVCLLLMNLKAEAAAVDTLGQNPLHLAVENDHPDVVKLFMKLKPELVSAASKSGMTCAHIAAKNGSEFVIKELLQFQKSLVTSVANPVNECLPIHYAVSASHEHVVKLLIDAGTSATAENNEGMTAIHLASREGDMEVLQAIIASSPRGSLKTNSVKNGMAPIHMAAFYGKSEIVRELQTRVDINSKTDAAQNAAALSDAQLKAMITIDYGYTPLHVASYMGRENVVRLILNNSSVNTDETTTLLGRVPMFYAAMNGHVVIVSLLLSRSAKHLKAVDKKGRQPLHLAAENGHADMVAMMLGQGADMNCADEDGWCPLHYATKNGFFNVVKLVIESGASPNTKTANGLTPLMLSAAGDHIDLVYYLLKLEHDSLELMEDKDFLMNLMLCSLSNDFETIEEFILFSKAPLHTVTVLARLYRELAFKEKERAKDLNDIARHCEHMATKLLGIASEVAAPSAILRATDAKGNQYLDQLLENNMKQVVEHPAVQRYLSDLWSGVLNTWSSFRFFMLFIGFMVCPPLLVYFCVPLRKYHTYYHIPVIKFLAMIVSNFYLIGFLSITAAVPLHPIVYRTDFYPVWEELFCLLWIGGMIVTELTKAGVSTGLGTFRYVIIFFGVIASVFQMAAMAVDDGPGQGPGRQQALIMMYNRNFMLSFSLFASIILIMDFMMIHHLFGPLGIIISSVTRDLMTFIVVLFIFLIGFSFQISCLFQSLESNKIDVASNNSESLVENETVQFENVTYPPLVQVTNLTDNGNFSEYFLGNESAPGQIVLFGRRKRQAGDVEIGANDDEDVPVPICRLTKSAFNLSQYRMKSGRIVLPNANLGELRRPADGTLKRKRRGVLGPRHQNHGASRKIRRKPKKSGGGSFWVTDASGENGAQSESDDEYTPPSLTNEDPTTLIILIVTLYFSMFAMGGPDILPTAQGAAWWSWIVFQVMFGMWMIISFIVLIPLLIAMLTETYKKIHMRSDLEWKFGRAQLIRSMIKQSAAPAPLNLVVRPALYIWSWRRHRRWMWTKYAQYFADEDEHEGADEAIDITHHKTPKKAKKSWLARLLTFSKCCAKVGVAIVQDVVAEEDDDEAKASVAESSHESKPMEEVLDWAQVVRLFRIDKAGGIEELAVAPGDRLASSSESKSKASNKKE